MKLKKEDMALGLFVTIHHHGDIPRVIMATMAECCEKINDDDSDCNAIQIFGEHLGVIQPGTTHNVTFLYPNIYGYNRKASCLVDIWNKREDVNSEDTNEIRHRIDFDTTIRAPSEEVPVHLQELYTPDNSLRCETTDLDPFDGCNPVDCRLKYLGHRNYFNHKRKRCQKVPKCKGDPDKELPDIVYVPTSNTCRNLENTCHHGDVDVRTGLCVCDKGWTSEPYDPEEYNQGSYVYHMCDKRCHPEATQSVWHCALFYPLFSVNYALRTIYI
ncbi:hypothetical protein Phum_PHUM171650 [Pediculus humanus corporis]|uniref:Uncharacterized protein n=1 Tax=Pediculus humanus subsp. corporis TaxID=121224 RepID=E0VG22_PEDHC|nr:uncharacterized protein Phum_PHUM171650 [Pediculus humanus corporis]EEB12328.1 hypothetical protein Phum_PHUM171650 [Pediculus humanus corporis]